MAHKETAKSRSEDKRTAATLMTQHNGNKCAVIRELRQQDWGYGRIQYAIGSSFQFVRNACINLPNKVTGTPRRKQPRHQSTAWTQDFDDNQ